MGMQRFIHNEIKKQETISKLETLKYGKDICPDCGKNKKDCFRNLFNTLECMCGRKFYEEQKKLE